MTAMTKTTVHEINSAWHIQTAIRDAAFLARAQSETPSKVWLNDLYDALYRVQSSEIIAAFASPNLMISLSDALEALGEGETLTRDQLSDLHGDLSTIAHLNMERIREMLKNA